MCGLLSTFYFKHQDEFSNNLYEDTNTSKTETNGGFLFVFLERGQKKTVTEH